MNTRIEKLETASEKILVKKEKKSKIDWEFVLVNYLPVLVLLFLFLVGVKSLSGSFEMMGSGFTEGLLNSTANPIISLMSGMLATVLVQSSSATTSIIVGLVSAGTLTVEAAVPMIMGANLGTSVTNTLVSLGYVSSNKNFSRAFAAGTIHDFFNFLSVLVILPIELLTGFLSKSATTMATYLYGSSESVTFSSPIKTAIKPFSSALEFLVTDILGLQNQYAGFALAFISGILIVAALALIVRFTKKIVESSKGEILERLLSKNPYGTVLFGAILTFAVQSSSITTSLLIPLAASGLLSLRAVFPVTVGANIGTTTTALLASLTGNVHGLTIALVHFLFNAFGTIVWFVPPFMRKGPLYLAELLAKAVMIKRRYGFFYVISVFFILPLMFSFLI